MSKTLVLEGGLRPAGAAVVVGNRIASWAEVRAVARGGEQDLFGAAQRALATASVAPQDISALIAGTGPGSYTGLRIALGLAHGFALGRPGLALGGVDSPRILAEAAAARLPVRVLIPWGRLRVLLAWAAAEGPTDRGTVLLPREELAGDRRLAGARVVLHPELADLPLPKRVRPAVAELPPSRALARLVARGAVGAEPGATLDALYLAPPDAVLPLRGSLLPDGFAIAPLGVADLPTVLAIERASFERPWSANIWRRDLGDDRRRMAIGVRDPDGALLAVALARLQPDAWSIESVAVAPGARRQGFGRALVRELTRRAREAGAPRLDLEVGVLNAAAIALYATEGFAPVGRRRRYYEDGSDALLMSLTLLRS